VYSPGTTSIAAAFAAASSYTFRYHAPTSDPGAPLRGTPHDDAHRPALHGPGGRSPSGEHDTSPALIASPLPARRACPTPRFTTGPVTTRGRADVHALVGGEALRVVHAHLAVRVPGNVQDTPEAVILALSLLLAFGRTLAGTLVAVLICYLPGRSASSMTTV